MSVPLTTKTVDLRLFTTKKLLDMFVASFLAPVYWKEIGRLSTDFSDPLK